MKINAVILVFILFITFQYSFAWNGNRTATNATQRLLIISENEIYHHRTEQKILEISIWQFVSGMYTLVLENEHQKVFKKVLFY